MRATEVGAASSGCRHPGILSFGHHQLQLFSLQRSDQLADLDGGMSPETSRSFPRCRLKADVRSAWSVYRQSGLTQSQTLRQVRDDVNEGYQNVANSRDKIRELNVEVQAAQKAADLAERSYQLGSESNLDRLTQQDNFLTAQLNLVSEQFNEKSSYLNLLRAAGALGTVLK
jgi:outer membrane protein TolC